MRFSTDSSFPFNERKCEVQVKNRSWMEETLAYIEDQRPSRGSGSESNKLDKPVKAVVYPIIETTSEN